MAVVMNGFVRPPKPNEKDYKHFKKLLSINPAYNLDPNPPTFFNFFKTNIYVILGGLAALMLTFVLFGDKTGGDGTGGAFLGVGGVIAAVISALSIMNESAFFNRYSEGRIRYYKELKVAIERSSSYLDFSNDFQ